LDSSWNSAWPVPSSPSVWLNFFMKVRTNLQISSLHVLQSQRLCRALISEALLKRSPGRITQQCRRLELCAKWRQGIGRRSRGERRATTSTRSRMIAGLQLSHVVTQLLAWVQQRLILSEPARCLAVLEKTRTESCFVHFLPWPYGQVVR
jgi:hypothetical protein